MIFRLILSAVLAYLLGSVSISVLLSKFVYRKDVRTLGSGNAGATNVARVYGMGAGLLTLVGDMAKAALSAWLGMLLCGKDGMAVACLGCIFGHCWPVYFSFRGGKGVSVAAAIALFYDWRMFLILVIVFFLMFAISRRVSLCSVSAALAYLPAYYLLARQVDSGFWVCCIVPVLVIVMHRENIKRLLHGQEAPFTPGKHPKK